MRGTKRDKPQANISANANFGLVAKATYARERKITEVVPPDVTRAKTTAWLDLISPLTEWAGLRGDELRHKREQLRLQREDTLSEIARRWKERSLDGLKTQIPIKFMVPFLEQASLEDPNSILVDLWANLLASASENFNSQFLHFINIISHISSEQGVIFREITDAQDLNRLEVAIDNISIRYEQHVVRKTVAREFLERVKQAWTDDNFAEFISELMDRTAVSIVHGSYENNNTKAYYDINFNYTTYEDGQEADYLILESLGLIRRVETDFFDVGVWSVSLIYYYITRLGFYFAKACKILPDATAR